MASKLFCVNYYNLQCWFINEYFLTETLLAGGVAVALKQAMSQDFVVYQKQVLKNAKVSEYDWKQYDEI